MNLLPLISLLLISSTHAQEVPRANQVILGSGIQNSVTREIVLEACVGKNEDGTTNCDTHRLISIKSGTASWLGMEFPALNTARVKDALSKWYPETIEEIFSFFQKKQALAFSDQTGWNWSELPLEVAHSKFVSITSMFVYYAALAKSVDSLTDPSAQDEIRQSQEDLISFAENINSDQMREYNVETQTERTKDQTISTRIELLKCVEDLIRKNHGGYQTPTVAYRVLSTAGSLNELTRLQAAKVECQQLKKHVKRVRARKLDREKLNQAYKDTLDRNKNQIAATLIQRLKYPSVVKCTSYKLMAKVAALLGVGAGASALHCLYSNGKTRNYVGARLAGVIGIAALIEFGTDLKENDEFAEVSNEHLTGLLAFQTGHRVNALTLLGGAAFLDANTKADDHFSSIGLGFEFSPYVGFMLRFFNGKRHWDQLLKDTPLN